MTTQVTYQGIEYTVADGETVDDGDGDCDGDGADMDGR